MSEYGNEYGEEDDHDQPFDKEEHFKPRIEDESYDHDGNPNHDYMDKSQGIPVKDTVDYQEEDIPKEKEKISGWIDKVSLPGPTGIRFIEAPINFIAPSTDSKVNGEHETPIFKSNSTDLGLKRENDDEKTDEKRKIDDNKDDTDEKKEYNEFDGVLNNIPREENEDEFDGILDPEKKEYKETNEFDGIIDSEITDRNGIQKEIDEFDQKNKNINGKEEENDLDKNLIDIEKKKIEDSSEKNTKEIAYDKVDEFTKAEDNEFYGVLDTETTKKKENEFNGVLNTKIKKENNIEDNKSETAEKTKGFLIDSDLKEDKENELTSEENIEDNKSGNDEKANKDFINGTLKNNIFKKDSNEKEDKETRIEIPENFFYKENNCYYCNDINLLKKIYETQKSFSKTELYLKTQACDYTPSLTTIQKLVRKSFESESEYKTWRSNIFLKEFQEIAREHGGECLSTEYNNSITKLNFRCKEGHEFEARAASVKYIETWCPTCAKKKKLTLEEFQEIAKERGGVCLSTEYDNSFTKLEFLCARGHRFEAKPVNVKNNDSWCPICSEGTSERVCGRLAEAILQRKFQSHVRFNWLRSEKNHLMHLDRYNDELKLAFEIQGIQHYVFPNRFHKTEEEFSRQRFLDQRKRELVEHHGITLIEVPFTIKYDKMQEYIIEQCRANGFKVQEPKSKIDWRKFRWYINDDDMSLNDWL